MNIENYLLDIIKGRKDGLVAWVVFVLLLLLSRIYRVLIYIRKKLYDFSLKTSASLDAKVISVGNITAGGTGKTPIVKRLANDLTNKGYRVVILSRGYKGDFTGELGVVSDGDKIFMSADEAGDEAYMLAKDIDSIPIIVGSKRSKTGNYACQRYNPDFIILDDGFQHWQVARDYDIVALDATNPFSNNHVLPAGLLREPLASLNRADEVVITKSDQVSDTELEKIKQKIANINSDLKTVTTRYKPTYLRDLDSNQVEEIDLKNKRIIAISGIGNPRYFEFTLEQLGAQTSKKVRYKDHHSYSKEEINRLFTLATVHNVDKIVTTEKDAVSIDSDLLEVHNVGIDFQALGIELDFLDNEINWQKILREGSQLR